MIKVYTDVQQGQMLLDAGLDKRTCDMWYGNGDDAVFGFCSKRTPAWSMARLMALLPDEIVINRDGRNRKTYHLGIDKFEAWRYNVAYYRDNYATGEVDVLYEKSSLESPLDALVDVLAWVVANGYEDRDIYKEIIKKNGEL